MTDSLKINNLTEQHEVLKWAFIAIAAGLIIWYVVEVCLWKYAIYKAKKHPDNIINKEPTFHHVYRPKGESFNDVFEGRNFNTRPDETFFKKYDHRLEDEEKSKGVRRIDNEIK